MSTSLGSIFGGIHRQGLFMRSLQHAMRLEERYPDTTDLSYVQVQVNKTFNSGIFSTGVQSFHCTADVRCTNPYRTGFSIDDDNIRIFNVEGLETFDGAFGFLTEQVEQAQNAYKSSRFRYYPNKELHSSFYNVSIIHEYDGLKKQWKPLFI